MCSQAWTGSLPPPRTQSTSCCATVRRSSSVSTARAPHPARTPPAPHTTHTTSQTHPRPLPLPLPHPNRTHACGHSSHRTAPRRAALRRTALLALLLRRRTNSDSAKTAATAWGHFVREVVDTVKAEHPGKSSYEIKAITGDRWRGMSENDPIKVYIALDGCNC